MITIFLHFFSLSFYNTHRQEAPADRRGLLPSCHIPAGDAGLRRRPSSGLWELLIGLSRWDGHPCAGEGQVAALRPAEPDVHLVWVPQLRVHRPALEGFLQAVQNRLVQLEGVINTELRPLFLRRADKQGGGIREGDRDPIFVS